MDTIYDAKILIVDDNAELLALLCEQLRGAGYGHIRTAQSCAAARACFAAEQPELMILDMEHHLDRASLGAISTKDLNYAIYSNSDHITISSRC